MTEDDQLEILKKGTKTWNKWRLKQPVGTYINFARAELYSIDLSEAILGGVTFFNAFLVNANFSKANLRYTTLSSSHLMRANLSGANLMGADLSGADLSDANLRGANLWSANLSRANLTGADLTGAILKEAILVSTTITGATFVDCQIFGLSAWDLIGSPKEQSNLIITENNEAVITVDDLQVGQFIYLLLNNNNVRNVIDTITSKTVLILGRFTEQRIAVLEAIREELRRHNFTPILFDFDKPTSKDITGTVETLARMARFIIADLTDPSSIPHELATIIPFLRTTPVLPIRLQGADGYSMFKDFQRSYPWVLATYEYIDNASLLVELPMAIAPANEMAEKFRNIT